MYCVKAGCNCTVCLQIEGACEECQVNTGFSDVEPYYEINNQE